MTDTAHITPTQQWYAALAALDDDERSDMKWRYRQMFRDDSWRGYIEFKDLPPAVQAKWIDFARKRRHAWPA